jgi:hypothetical protein
MLIQKIAEYFKSATNSPQSYRSGLEQFILSKNPTSIEDVEYWTRQFDLKIQTNKWWETKYNY